MNGFLLFLWGLSSALILCQWYVLLAVRRYLFGQSKDISRFKAYSLLALLGLVNVGGVLISMSDQWLPLAPFYKKVVAVGFFSYLGFAMVLGFYFGLIRLAEALAEWFQRRFVKSLQVGAAGSLAVDERGCFVGKAASKSPPNLGDDEFRIKSPPVDYDREQDCSDLEKIGTLRPPEQLDTSNVGRRTVLKIAAAGGLLVGSTMVGNGILQAYQKPVREKWDFGNPMLKGLSQGSLTIVHVTDFHFGLFLNAEDLELLVERLNDVEGDALFVTGDIYHSPLTPIETSIPILRRLKPRRIGNFAVLGNHEFYAGVGRSLTALDEANIKVLRNEWHTYEDNGVRLHIGGIDDPVKNWLTGTSFPKFSYLMKIAPVEPGMKILLSHRPSILPEASKANLDLVLSGHTHGGQIILPSFSKQRGVSLARIVSPFTHGWYHMGNTSMYLNRGIGLTFIPWRINCPPEIAVFRLRNSELSS